MSSQNTTSTLLSQLDAMISEGRNPETHGIDLMSTRDVLTLINREDSKVAEAVKAAIPAIANIVDKTVQRIQQGGRLFYLGAGTSGRLGILDAVECRPTFSVPDGLVIGVIAGGEPAIQHAVEGAEDNTQAGANDLQHHQFSSQDVLVGIAASGRTPYVIGALQYARSIGADTAALSCNPNAAIFDHADVAICAQVGPECLTGSTRMKSGTAQKLILNMISTTVMIRLGKTYQNLMVDVNATNEKLKARAIRIVMQATGASEADARTALVEAEFNAKTAILMLLTGMNKVMAEQALLKHNGFLRKAAEQPNG